MSFAWSTSTGVRAHYDRNEKCKEDKQRNRPGICYRSVWMRDNHSSSQMRLLSWKTTNRPIEHAYMYTELGYRRMHSTDSVRNLPATDSHQCDDNKSFWKVNRSCCAPISETQQALPLGIVRLRGLCAWVLWHLISKQRPGTEQHRHNSSWSACRVLGILM